jgi:hypothetical protein
MPSAILVGGLAGLLIGTAAEAEQERRGHNHNQYHPTQRKALHHFSFL